MSADGRLSLLWRVVLVNAAVLAAGGLILAVTPATISSRITTDEAAVLAAGLVAIVVIQVVLLRRTLAPLRRLTRLMHDVDPMLPGRRVSGVPARDREVAELTAAFNAMLDRLESERQASVGRALAAQEQERSTTPSARPSPRSPSRPTGRRTTGSRTLPVTRSASWGE